MNKTNTLIIRNRIIRKKGQAKEFGEVAAIVLGILAIMIVARYFILNSGNSGKFIDELKKFQSAGLNFSSNFGFKAESVALVPVLAAGETTILCDQNDKSVDWTCTKGSTVHFDVSISNNGALPSRIYYASVIICRSDDKTCVNKVYARGVDDCLISRGETKACDSGKYVFSTPGTYSIIPVAECALDTKMGCINPDVPSNTMQRDSNIAKAAKIIITG